MKQRETQSQQDQLLTSKQGLTIDTVIERRDWAECVVELTITSASIFSGYTEITGPPSIGPALEYIRDHKRFRVADLPHLRDDTSRLVLARRLILEGILRVVGEDRKAKDCLSMPSQRSATQNDAIGGGKGMLVIVGSGIKSLAHQTVEAQGWIQKADVVLHCLSDPLTSFWIKQQVPDSIDLVTLYSKHRQRSEVYEIMVERMMKPVREGKTVCAIYYGHPGLFVTPTHRAIEAARAEGYFARMLPGLSAIDCLFADVGFDPSVAGCQIFEATDMLLHRRVLHPENNLILWQIGLVGNYTSQDDTSKLPILIDYMMQFYDPECEVVHYQASVFPICNPTIDRLPLRELGQGAKVTSMSTLFVPPQVQPKLDRDMARRLGLFADKPRIEECVLHEMTELPSYQPLPDQSALASFLLTVAAEPDLLCQFENDPQQAAKDAGLSPCELRALISRMPGRIWAAVEGSADPTGYSGVSDLSPKDFVPCKENE